MSSLIKFLDEGLSIPYKELALQKRKRSNEKENSINKNDRTKNPKKKTNRKIYTGTSLSNIVTNPLPNLKYLQLKLEKSNSSIKSVERRLSDNISS
ncbi:10734_t:CDS:2 [Cetraspora pellucida]|uniref:10734_t:CDS:1 n=1 Tax=Cetraspora pellucida TaxID=1433469 RepID=A0ACA9L2T3_9GLOM|nr:10734_t:CDS:2 [Cetraspora pellucida]